MNRDKGAGKRAARTALAYVLTLFMILSVMPAPVVRASGAVVYLDGENGSDENSGADSDNAVASFYQAGELLGGSGTIIVTNTLTVSGERDWYSESDVVLKASDYLDGPVIRIKEGGSLSIGGVTVSGGDVLIKNSGSLNLDGVTLRVWGEKVSAPEGIVTTDSGVTMLYGETLDGSSDDGQDSGEEWTEASGESEEGQGEDWTEAAGDSSDGQGEGWTEASGESEDGQSEGWTEASEESSEKQSENAAEESEKSTGSQGQDMTETQAAEQTEAKPEASEAQTETSGKQTEAQTEASEKSTEAHGEGWTEVTEGSSEGESEAVTEKQSESQTEETEPAGQQSGSQSESQAAGSEGQTETETESEIETESETEAKDPVTAFMDAARALQVSSRDDVMQVLAVSKMFDRLTEEELSQVSQGAIEALWTAQSISSELNKTQSGVTVIGDFPWFVQFRVVLRDKSETASSEEGMDIIAPYELCLWNLYDDIPYYLPEGQQVTVMIPAPQGENAQEPVIFHYKADGSYEKIIPRQENGMLVFETSSFSPFSIAGSTVISGIGINGQTADSPGKGSGTKDETEKKDNTTGGSSTGGTSKPGNATPGGNSTGGSSTGSGSTGGTNSGSTGTQNNNTTPQTTPSTGTGSSGQGQNNSGTVKSNTGAPRTADETDIFLYVMMAAGAVLLMAGALFASRRKLEDL